MKFFIIRLDGMFRHTLVVSIVLSRGALSLCGGGGGIRTHGGFHHAGFQDLEDTKSEGDVSPDKDS